MEMSSKNALAVMDDGDLDIASAIALGGAFGGSGQKCTASARLIVHEKVHDALVEKLGPAVNGMVVDHALKEGTQMGPVVSETQLNEKLAYMDLAREEGGEVLCGGERVERDTDDGYYMTPSIVAGTSNSWWVNREEMFALIACTYQGRFL